MPNGRCRCVHTVLSLTAREIKWPNATILPFAKYTFTPSHTVYTVFVFAEQDKGAHRYCFLSDGKFSVKWIKIMWKRCQIQKWFIFMSYVAMWPMMNHWKYNFFFHFKWLRCEPFLQSMVSSRPNDACYTVIIVGTASGANKTRREEWWESNDSDW